MLAYLIKKGRDDFQHLVLLDSIERGFDIHLDKIKLWSGISYLSSRTQYLHSPMEL